MATYNPVPGNLWGPRLKRLTGPAKLLYLYVLTCPARRSEGIFELAPEHVAADTGLEPEHIERAWLDLESAGLAYFDADAEVVLDLEALRAQPLVKGGDKPDKRIAPAVRSFRGLRDTPLRDHWLWLVVQTSPGLAEALEDAGVQLPDQAPKPLSPSAPSRVDRGVHPSESPQAPKPLRGEEEQEHENEKEQEVTGVAPLSFTCSCGTVVAKGDPASTVAGKLTCGFCNGGAS